MVAKVVGLHDETLLHGSASSPRLPLRLGFGRLLGQALLAFLASGFLLLDPPCVFEWARPAFVSQAATVVAALRGGARGLPTRVLGEGTAGTRRAVLPRRLDTFLALGAMPPLPPVLGRTDVTQGAVLVLGPHVSGAHAAEPVSLLLGQDDVSGRQVGEQPDGGYLPARLPVFVEGVVVIVHLVVQHGEGREALQDA